MDRRKFLKNGLLATGGVIAAPYILPTGRLFAGTGTRLANHVVFCLFAGGVRNFESVQKAEGNLMRNTLYGTESISADIAPGIHLLPGISSNPLQHYGTMFKEFRYNIGPTGHFNGHTTAMTGVYTAQDINLKQPPKYPTVFEYYRKHTSPSQSALNAWWVSNSLGPYPFLNYSIDTNYGAPYGANFIQPASFISQNSYNAVGNPKTFSSQQLDEAKALKKFLNANFKKAANYTGTIENTEVDQALLESFIQNTFTEAASGLYSNPWGVGANNMNNDMMNVFFAEKLIQQYKPELLVVNMQDVDIAHFDFTQYCNHMVKADYALAHLWNTIQSTPGMANDTILIAVPEHGRNLASNTVMDQYGRYALDHNNDQTSREIFCLVLGPQGVVVQNQVISTVMGESIDVVPTIGKILGFYEDIPGYYQSLMGSPLNSAFV